MKNSLEERISFLEEKLAATQSNLDDLGSAFERFVDAVTKNHHELHDYAYRAYCKTHPEYCKSMDQYHDIVMKGQKPPSDDKVGRT